MEVFKFNDIKNIILASHPIDENGVIERTNGFKQRSIKKRSKLYALNLAVSMVDLTTLEGADTRGKVIQLCNKAKNPLPTCFNIMKHEDFIPIPHVGAVCVYPQMAKTASSILKGTGIQIACVSTGFPSGQLDLNLKLKDVEYCLKNGATEIDMVIDRGAFLSGDYKKVFEQIVQVKALCGQHHLKVILETGELKSMEKIYRASMLAMYAGADFIKTSTGKVSPAATMPSVFVMLNAIWDFFSETGVKIGMKPAGGIRTSKDAIAYLVMLNETLGQEWMNPTLFRFGASSLLNDLLRQLMKYYTGIYYSDDMFSKD